MPALHVIEGKTKEMRARLVHSCTDRGWGPACQVRTVEPQAGFLVSHAQGINCVNILLYRRHSAQPRASKVGARTWRVK